MTEETSEELELINGVLKKYSRILKALFNNFAGSAYKKVINKTPSFDKLKRTKECLSESDFSKMLKSFNVFSSKFSVEHMKTVYNFLTTKLRTTEIQYENFPELIFLIALLKHNKEETFFVQFPPAWNLEIFFQSLKNNEGTLPSYYFEDPNFGYGDRDVAKAINAKLLKDPEFPIPENYKKYKELNLSVCYKAVLCKDSQKIVVELIDEILWQGLGVHFLMPIVEKKYLVRAKGVLGFHDSRNPSSKYLPKIESIPGFAKLSPNIKFHAVSLQHLPIDSLLESAKLIDDLIYSVEKNSFVLISKLPKPAGTISNRVTQEKILKEIEKINESERLEQKRKKRIKIIGAHVTKCLSY